MRPCPGQLSFFAFAHVYVKVEPGHLHSPDHLVGSRVSIVFRFFCQQSNYFHFILAIVWIYSLKKLNPRKKNKFFFPQQSTFLLSLFFFVGTLEQWSEDKNWEVSHFGSQVNSSAQTLWYLCILYTWLEHQHILTKFLCKPEKLAFKWKWESMSCMALTNDLAFVKIHFLELNKVTIAWNVFT